MSWSRGLRSWARGLERDVHALYLAARDPRVPWYAKSAALCVAAYALSPIDLVPDFVPVLGYLDDALLVPLGIWVVVRLIPPEILAEHRAAAAERERPVSRAGAALVIVLWLLAAAALAWLAWPGSETQERSGLGADTEVSRWERIRYGAPGASTCASTSGAGPAAPRSCSSTAGRKATSAG